MKSRPNDHTLLPIGEAARLFAVGTHVLRHWEAIGLVKPVRQAGQRRYSRDDLGRIAAIVRAKEAGLGLDAIRVMVTGGRSDAPLRLAREEEPTAQAARGIAGLAPLDRVRAGL